MPANWSILQSQLTTWFDNNQVRKTESDTANAIAQAYYNAILSANIVTVPGSLLAAPASPSLIKQGFEATFRILKSKTSAPVPGDFTIAANSIVIFWQTSFWNPIPPPIGYVGPTVGHSVISGGSPAPLNYNLWNAFNNKIPGKVGVVIATKLINAFTVHLTQVQGVYNGLIPSPTGPVPGPPFPWLGVA